jgi:hypothetical protein
MIVDSQLAGCLNQVMNYVEPSHNVTSGTSKKKSEVGRRAGFVDFTVLHIVFSDF